MAIQTGGVELPLRVGCAGNFSLRKNSSGSTGRDNFGQIYVGAGLVLSSYATVKNNPLFVSAQHTGPESTPCTGGSKPSVAGRKLRRVALGRLSPGPKKYDLDGTSLMGETSCAVGADA